MVACPINHYPLPSMEQLIDAIVGYQVLSFLDTFSGYHQIAINREDMPKIALITSKGRYTYIKMPIGLKNAGVTFQILMNKVFKKKIKRNMEYYVDDMIVKLSFKNHADYLVECVEILKRNKMRINPYKYTFGVASAKFLVYIVST